MNEKHTNHASINLVDGLIMVLGGEYNMNSAHCEVYDPELNDWIQISNIEPGYDLNRGGAFPISDTKILIIYGVTWGIYDTELFISLGYYHTKNYLLTKRPMHELLPDNSVISMGGWIFTINGHFGPNRFSEVFKPSITSVGEEIIESLDEFELYNNYPNPFNPTTTIKYSIPTRNAEYYPAPQNVTLIVYDILGKEVTTLVDQKQQPGNYEVQFSAKGGSGSAGDGSSVNRRITSGIYFYRLKADEFLQTKKMLLIR
jgi:hypothetical protein